MICAVVIRGDSGAENRLYSAEKYFQIAQEAKLGCVTCFIASDDIVGALKEVDGVIEGYLPGCKVMSLPDDHPLTSTGFRERDFNMA